MKNSMKIKANQQGFTLIELVVVIVILAILAVTAAPKFIDLQDDARTATVAGMSGALKSASALVHSKSLVTGNEGDPTATIDVSGSEVNIIYGYPTDAINDWANILDSDGFEASSTDGVLIFYPEGNAPTLGTIWAPGDDAEGDAKCFAYYVPATEDTTPVIGSVECVVASSE
ncbi:MAG: prepilin-type N-terminal cleavage/methylation domain-containing protein [Colwellia sp.]